MSITITLPWPDAALSPNSGKASMYPAIKARRAYRDEAGWVWIDAMVQESKRCGWKVVPPLTPPVVADITFTYTAARLFDIDNHIAMLKPVWDGAQDAGVIANDSADVFSIGTVEFVKGKERGVTVTLASKEAI